MAVLVRARSREDSRRARRPRDPPRACRFDLGASASWFEHRVFKGPDTDVNLHVFTVGCPEVDQMLLFRDWLRSNVEDRDLYAAQKRALAAREWKYTQNYADAKSSVVQEILARARASRRGRAD
jgi:GrpB-like predicted nucleotidyltransferase (UPF0157 family)